MALTFYLETNQLYLYLVTFIITHFRSKRVYNDFGNDSIGM